MEALQTFRDSPAFDVFQHIIETLANQRVIGLLSAEVTQVEFERGRLAALREVHDVVDSLLTRCKELDRDRTKRNGDPSHQPLTAEQRAAHHWGNPLWFGRRA